MDERINRQSENRGNGFNFLALSILISAILISGSILYSNSGTKNAKSKQDPKTEVAQIAQSPTTNQDDVLKINQDDVILGNPEAPVILIEYGDYECPFCEKFFTETEPLIRKNYIETGKVKMIYRDFPLPGHPYAQPAAEAANCAKDQNKFWAYHDIIFQKQKELPNVDYLKLANELGLNTEQFKQCLEAQKYKDKIKKDYEGGTIIGVNGTPTFFINGQKVVGAQPYSVFEKIIEEALKQKQS